ncbi:hypothetical protein Tco_0943589 [Tanacetum coccineum]
MFSIRSFRSLSLVLVGSCFPMATVSSGYLVLTIILYSTSSKWRTFLAIFEHVALDFFFLSSFLGGSYVDSTMPTPLEELHRMITMLRTSVLVREPYPILISKGTSPRGQECSPKKPTSGTRSEESLVPETGGNVISPSLLIDEKDILISWLLGSGASIRGNHWCRVHGLHDNSNTWSCRVIVCSRSCEGPGLGRWVHSTRAHRLCIERIAIKENSRGVYEPMRCKDTASRGGLRSISSIGVIGGRSSKGGAAPESMKDDSWVALEARFVSDVFSGVLAVKVEAVIGGSSLALGPGKGVMVEKPGGGVISLPFVMPEKPTAKGVGLRVILFKLEGVAFELEGREMDNPDITMEEYVQYETEKAPRKIKCITGKLLSMIRSAGVLILKILTASDF